MKKFYSCKEFIEKANKAGFDWYIEVNGKGFTKTSPRQELRHIASTVIYNNNVRFDFDDVYKIAYMLF